MESGFTYWTDATGQATTLGVMQFTTQVGSYWSGSTTSQGSAVVYFTRPHSYRWYELFASALEGWLYRVGILGWPSRAVLLAAGATLIYPDPLTDVIGLAAIGSVYAVHFLFVRKRPGAA